MLSSRAAVASPIPMPPGRAVDARDDALVQHGDETVGWRRPIGPHEPPAERDDRRTMPRGGPEAFSCDDDDEVLRRLWGLKDAAPPLTSMMVQGLAERLGVEALLDVLVCAAQSGLRLRLEVGDHRARGRGCPRFDEVRWLDGHVVACGRDGQLHWREDVPGQQAWLLRSPRARGLTQSLLLLAPSGALRLCLGAATSASGAEPCAWREALDAVREDRASDRGEGAWARAAC